MDFFRHKFGDDEQKIQYIFPFTDTDFKCNELGNFISINRTYLAIDKDEKKYEKFMKEAMKSPLNALVGIYTISPESAPLAVYQACLYLFNTVRKWPPGYATGVGLRLVQSAKIVGKLKDLYENKTLEELISKDVESFAAPYLFLTATLCKPIDVDYPIPSHYRTAALQMYYSGVNQLLLNHFEKAQKQFTHSLTLSSACKEMKQSIVNYLGIACFLNGASFKVYQTLVPLKCNICKAIKDIFNLKPLDQNKLGSFAPYYAALLNERARRMVVEIASTTSTISYSDLEDLVKPAKLDKVLSATAKDVTFVMKDDIILFDEPSMVGRIEREIEIVNETLMPLVKVK